jgi:predicted metal-binding membrane protein
LTDVRTDFSHLTPGAARLGAIAAKPRAAAVLCVLVLTGAGWLYLGIVAGAALAQGGGVAGLFRALCAPLGASFGMPSASAGELLRLLLVFAMWVAMALAMMLPSAAPMIMTYAEIADTAARRRQPVITPLALAAGYAAVWIAFAGAAALLQIVLTRFAVLNVAMTPESLLASGLLFVLAGAYQFSSLKQSCLRACQRPFPFFFANWKTTARGVFGLGLRQGLHCLGCCWALMLLMLAVGVMNAVWMAGLAVVMTLEKLSATSRLSRAIGILLVAIGVALAGADLLAAARS